MKQVLLSDLREGELFVLTDKVKHNAKGEILSKYVYIKDKEYYYRGEKRCAVCKFDVIDDWKEMKVNRKVWIDFMF